MEEEGETKTDEEEGNKKKVARENVRKGEGEK